MLRSLSIRDVVLIERLDLSFDDGLCVLTGETGAGKSILLDALGLALGVRAEARLVRQGAKQAVVSAVFEPAAESPASAMLRDHGIDTADGLVLRRVLATDGRSRAFVNDEPVSIGFVKRLGEELVEIHGQFESQRLLNVGMHRGLLDTHGGLAPGLAETARCFRAWQAAGSARRRLAADIAKARTDESYLRHAADELALMAPASGEETQLAEQRQMMMHGEQLLDALKAASTELGGSRGAEASLRAALRHLERVAEKAGGRMDEALDALSRAAAELADGMAQVDRASMAVDLDPRALENIEERLFALRALARKHNTDVESLPALRARMEADLAALEDGGAELSRLEQAERQAREAYVASARKLSQARAAAAARLDKAVAGELEPLRLGAAAFITRVDALNEADWSEQGADRVAFEVATNPGTAAGPLNKIASGGELARFMLALKVVLAEADNIPSIVFDEVDAGIGGAVAAAVGERLARLAETVQVLVVTHSPQVAARGAHHWQVSKSNGAGASVVTSVDSLDSGARLEEIARMLAGEVVTDEARAAAGSLLRGGGAP